MSKGGHVVGVRDILNALDKSKVRYANAVRAAVYQKGLAIIADAVRRTPVDKGRLRASHYVAPPEGDGTTEIGFGTDYAVPVHEVLDAHHPVGEAKFLEKSVDEHRAGYTQWIGKKAIENAAADIAPGKVQATAPKKPRVSKSQKGKSKV